MLASSVPVRFQQPFANNAGVSYTRAIPNTTTDPAAASLNLGFPPACFVDVALGGTPPNGMDFNGILYEITANNQWVQAGGFAAYDSAFSTAIGGYPNNAVLQMATGKGFWKSTVDNNTSNPDTSGANWVPAAIAPGAYLDLNVAGAVDVTLTSVQAANRVIDLFGALTGNINVIVPTATGNWIFNNGTSGNFTITVKTAAGTGVQVVQGYSAELWSDAVNVYPGGLGKATADAIYMQKSGSRAFIGVGNATAEANPAVQVDGAEFVALGGGSALANNLYHDGTNWRYTANGAGQIISFDSSGNIIFYYAATGTAGAIASLVEQGRLPINATSGAGLDIRGLGAGQILTNVSGSRALGGVYTNSTGRTIQVIVQCNLVANGWILGAASTLNRSSVTASTTITLAIEFEVEPSATYTVTSSAASFVTWYEIR